MAIKTRKLTKEELNRLKALPQRAERWLEGGIYPLVGLTTGNPFSQPPRLIVWVDGDRQWLYCQLVRPGETKDDGQANLIEALLTIIAAPQADEPTLPGQIKVNEESLAEGVGRLLAPVKIEVQFEAQPPILTDLFSRLAEIIGPLAPTSLTEPFTAELAAQPELLTELFRAVGGLWRTYPPGAVSDRWPVEIKTGSNDTYSVVGTFYASLRERYERPAGIVFYPSLATFQQDQPQWEDPASPTNTELEEVLSRLETIEPKLTELFLPDELSLIATYLRTKDQPVYYADCLKLYFDRAEEIAPDYLKWLSAHKLRYASRQAVPVLVRQLADGSQRSLNETEVRELTTALAGLGYFFYFEGRWFGAFHLADATKNHPVKVMGGKYLHSDQAALATAWAEVTFPPAGTPIEANDTVGFELSPLFQRPGVGVEREPNPLVIERNPLIGWLEIELNEEEEPPDPPTPLGPRLLYTLQVRLAWLPNIWRRIEIRGDQTLVDLHHIIQEAFGWDDDHLYSFFLSGQRWDRRSEYVSPWADDGRSAALYRLESLHLRPGLEFLYLFDYGDELQHLIKVEAVRLGGVLPGQDYPRITFTQGQNVPQYPNWSDEDDEDSEEL